MEIKKCCVGSFPLQLLHLSSLLNKLRKACLQAHNQLGTTGGAKSFLRGTHVFISMSSSFKLYPTHFSRGAKNLPRSPGYGPAFSCVLYNIKHIFFK